MQSLLESSSHCFGVYIISKRISGKLKYNQLILGHYVCTFIEIDLYNWNARNAILHVKASYVDFRLIS